MRTDVLNCPTGEQQLLLPWVILTMITAGVFLIDLCLPRGISVFVLYMVPLLLTAWLPHRRLPLLFAPAYSGLIVVGWFFSSPAVPAWISVSNRMFGVLAIWIIAVLLLKHQQTEESLRTTEARFHQMAEIIPEAFWVASPKVSETTYVSLAYEKLWGRSRESLYAEPTSRIEAIHPEDREHLLPALAHYRQGENQVEYRILRPDGSVRWIWEHGYPVRDEHGELIRIIGIAKDITEHKRAEEERERLVQQLREALDNVKTLKGLLALCSSCQRVRDERGAWKDLPTYVRAHSEANFSHSLCPTCGEALFSDFYRQRSANTH